MLCICVRAWPTAELDAQQFSVMEEGLLSTLATPRTAIDPFTRLARKEGRGDATHCPFERRLTTFFVLTIIRAASVVTTVTSAFFVEGERLQQQILLLESELKHMSEKKLKVLALLRGRYIRYEMKSKEVSLFFLSSSSCRCFLTSSCDSLRLVFIFTCASARTHTHTTDHAGPNGERLGR